MSSNENNKSEEQVFIDSVCSRLRDARESIGITETQLGEAIGRKQGTVSRIFKGEGLNLKILFKLCKELNVDITEILTGNPKKVVTEAKGNNEKKSEESIITDATSVRFTGYLGKYYGYFFSTEDSNEKIHDGCFTISRQSKTNKCIASFTFETGVINEKTGKYNVKKYKGPVKLSQRLGAISCELTAQDKSGDVSYIIFEHEDKINQSCESALGMAVTICAGGSRHPVAQRFLICRQELSDDDLYYISGQLKLNEKKILISEKEYKEFIKDNKLPDSFDNRDEQGEDILLKNTKPQKYYQFTEGDIAKVASMSDVDLAKTISLLRKHSSSRPSTKVGKDCGDYIFKYLKDKKTRESRGDQ